ncbi:hypothetical protein STRAU_3173 [Streptomyces aurantiacus JA 4570]|uniref:Uncharacterized protein n=1 Tax=Streptomyces aurantiacus JA 4570 TaxID=1286094 RepID=S4AQL6_9ACTN|nr:hypothetical protein STRAU_3173 [Streptomyces aurantiacus JA 4570]
MGHDGYLRGLPGRGALPGGGAEGGRGWWCLRSVRVGARMAAFRGKYGVDHIYRIH